MPSDFEALIFIQSAPTSAATWQSQENHHPQEAETRSWDHWTGHPLNPWIGYKKLSGSYFHHADNLGLVCMQVTGLWGTEWIYSCRFLFWLPIVCEFSFLFLFCLHLSLHVLAFLISSPSLFLWPRFTGCIWNMGHLSQKPCLQAVAPRLRSPEWTIQIFQS